MKKLHLRTLLISLVLIGSVLWACKEKPFCDPVFDATFNETGEKFEIGGWGNIGVSGELIDNYTTKKLRIEWIDTCRIGVHYSFSDTMINAYYRLSERTDTTWYREKYYQCVCKTQTLERSRKSLQWRIGVRRRQHTGLSGFGRGVHRTAQILRSCRGGAHFCWIDLLPTDGTFTFGTGSNFSQRIRPRRRGSTYLQTSNAPQTKATPKVTTNTKP